MWVCWQVKSDTCERLFHPINQHRAKKGPRWDINPIEWFFELIGKRRSEYSELIKFSYRWQLFHLPLWLQRSIDPFLPFLNIKVWQASYV